MSLYKMSLKELSDLISAKKISCEELTISLYERIDEAEKKVNAYITLLKDRAIEKAKALDKKIADGERMSLFTGIPIAVKDNICTKDICTTCASKMLENFIPPYNATVVEKLNDEDMIILGKTNLDEFAMGSSTENSAFKITKNPWDISRVPGGSSGGSAAAVAAGECVAALGSDTGGSIRQPAAFCGVVGIKPTYGAVSRYGLVAFASSLDQIGLFTRDVTDCALLLNVICGYDFKDSTSVKYDKPDYAEYLQNDIKGLKIGIPKEYLSRGLDSKVHDIFKKAIDIFESLGAVIEEVSLPHTDYALPTYYLIATAEASSNLARYDGVRYGYRSADASDVQEMFINSRSEGFGDEVKRRIMLGTYVLSSGYYDAYYLKALKVRTLIKKDFDDLFKDYDLILSPATPTTAFKIGENISDPLKMYLQDIFTLSVNLAGLPGMSLPAGFADNLPVGVQIIGKHFDEGTMLRAAYNFEQSLNLEKRIP